MPRRLLYDPITKRKLRPRFKFNGGHGAILCRKCGKIIKENISRHDLESTVENLFCAECATEMLMNFFKINKNEPDETERIREDS